MSHLDKAIASIYQDVLDDPRQPMTLRIGMAGPRVLSAQETSLAQAHLSTVLESISETLVDYIANEEVAGRIYNLAKHPKPALRLTSSLAIGADRLIMSPVISDVLIKHTQVEYAAVLPFLPDACEQAFYDDNRSNTDNQQDWDDFTWLIDSIKKQPTPRLIALDGDPKTPDSRDKAHFRCSEILSQNSDLLIAVTKPKHNPTPSNHRGGTSATIIQAKALGRPIIEIRLSEDGHNASLWLHQANLKEEFEEIEAWSEDSLERMLSRLVLFGNIFNLPKSQPKRASSVTPTTNGDKKTDNDEKGKVRKHLILAEFENHINDSRALKIDNKQLPDFDFKGPINIKPSKRLSLLGYNAFDLFKRFVSNKKDITKHQQALKTAVKTPLSENGKSRQEIFNESPHDYFAYFLRADALAIQYAAIHRSTYFLIYLFAALALITAATALTFQDIKPFVIGLMGLEALFLLMIYSLYKNDKHNHHKWLQNRCLAESIRPNIYLSGLGHCFSFFHSRSNEEFMYRELLGHQESGAQWVGIQAELINRHLGFKSGIYTKDFQRRSFDFIRGNWLYGQIQYHQSNAATMQSIGNRLSKSTHALFFLTVAALTVKAAILLPEKLTDLNLLSNIWVYALYKASSLLTAAFPIIGTAIFAIRNQSELDISAQRSRTMLAFFNGVYITLSSKVSSMLGQEEQTRYQSSESLDSELKRLSEVSAKEVSDWLEIYEVKESEPG